MRFRGVSTWVAAALAVAPLAHAEKDPIKPSLAYARPAPNLQGTMDLSLSDALSLGLENNLVIAIQRHQPLISHEDARAAWGAYDPLWDTEFGYADDEVPTASLLAGTDTAVDKRTGGSGGLSGLVPFLNMAISASVATDRSKQNIQFQILAPEYSSGLTLIARQPLLRGLIWSEPWTLVKTSRVQEEADWEQFRADVMDTVLAIEEAYWQLIADDELVRVAEKSVQTAQALLDQVQTQYEVGVVSKVEIAEAEAGLAQREFDLIVAQNTYGNTNDLLTDLTLGPNLTGDSRIQLNPTDRTDEYIAYDVDTGEATEIAFANRPELAVVRKQIEQLGIRLKFAKNQRLPSFDVEGRYGKNGLAGEQNPAAANLADPDFIGDWDDSFDFRTNSFEVRGILSVPLGNIRGRADVSRAKLELRRAEIRRRQQEQEIILEVRQRARALKSAQEGIRAAGRAQAAAAEQLRAERIRLEYGESTPFDVLLREQDLVTAEQRYIDAFRVYRQAITGLDRAQGTILRNRNIQIEEVAKLR